MNKLSSDEVAQQLAALPGWAIDGEKLFREFTFTGFPAAIGFMTAMAVAAEAMNHHPEWSNTHRKVKVWLVSHEAGGITALDVELARKMNAFATGPLAG